MAKKSKKKSGKDRVNNAARPAQTRKKQDEKPIRIDTGEVVRLLVGFFAVFLILTFIPSVNSGWLGGAIPKFFKGLFGPLYYALPFFIFLIIIPWRHDRERGSLTTRYLLYFLEFVFVAIIVQVVVAGDDISFGTLYEKGQSLESAGLIGGAVAMIFTSTIGNIASTILAIFGIIICTVFLFGSTPKAMFESIKGLFREVAEKVDREQPDDDDDGEEDEPAVLPERKRRIEAEDMSADRRKRIEAEDLVSNDRQREKKPKRRSIFSDELPDDPFGDPAETAEIRGGKVPFVPTDVMPAANAEVTPSSVQTVMPAISSGSAPAEPKEEHAAEPAAPEKPAAETVDDTEELFLDPVEDTPYVFPPISLLTAADPDTTRPSQADIERTSRKLEEVLQSFNVKAHVINCTCGPTVTRYELQPEVGVRVKAIVNLSDDIALHLAAKSVRIENVPGKVAVGIEIPNKNVYTVRLRALIENPKFRDNKSRLFCALGEDVAGEAVYMDIAKMPHILIAGATGMGKSVCINSLIVSLLYRNHPNDVKLILIDPKKVEFQPYNDIPHLLVPVITEPKSAAGTLAWACNEMEKRYSLIQEVGVRDLAGYNNITADDPERQAMPQIVIFIDELADLMMTAHDDVETSICRLAQKARAAGIHLVIGTQSPRVDVITGLIKANIPSRIACTVASQMDSRVILDMNGAEKLLGRGDMLYAPVTEMKPIRVQGAFVDDKTELAGITQFIREAAVAHYDESIMQQIENEAKLCGVKGKKGAAAVEEGDENEKSDPMLMEALGVAIECGTVSTSLLQRRLSLGYARAARIVDQMERKGFIGQFDAATKKRAILISHEQYLEMKVNNAGKNESGEE